MLIWSKSHIIILSIECFIGDYVYRLDEKVCLSNIEKRGRPCNIYFEKIHMSKVKNALFYGWKHGLKTGCYYMKSIPGSEAIKIIQSSNLNQEQECTTCSA